MTMRINYQPLNEAQLHRLLQGYNLGRKSPPYCWLPPPEDRHQAMQDGRRLLNIKIYTASALYYYNGYLSSREIILFYCFNYFCRGHSVGDVRASTISVSPRLRCYRPCSPTGRQRVLDSLQKALHSIWRCWRFVAVSKDSLFGLIRAHWCFMVF